VPWSQQPFFQVAVPVMVTFVLATWYQSSRITDLRDSLGKRIDDLRSEMSNRFAAIERRLERLEEKVELLAGA
jgi:hypothetical protein